MSEQKRIELNTPIGKLMFLNLRQPRKIDPSNEQEQPKYQTTIVFDEEAQQTAEFKKMRQAVKKAAEARWGEIPKKMRSPFKTPDDLENVPEGMQDGDVFVRLNSTSKPGVVDRNLEDILDDEQIYSGMYGRVNVQCYAWEHKQGGKGVSFGLGPVQKTGDGPRLGGGQKPAKNAFEALPTEDDDMGDDDEDGLL